MRPPTDMNVPGASMSGNAAKTVSRAICADWAMNYV